MCLSLIFILQAQAFLVVSNNSEFSLTMCRTRLSDTCYRVSSSPVGVLSNSLVAVDLFEVGWAFQKHQSILS